MVNMFIVNKKNEIYFWSLLNQRPYKHTVCWHIVINCCVHHRRLKVRLKQINWKIVKWLTQANVKAFLCHTEKKISFFIPGKGKNCHHRVDNNKSECNWSINRKISLKYEHKVWLEVHYDNLISVFYFHSMMASLIGIEVFLSI